MEIYCDATMHSVSGRILDCGSRWWWWCRWVERWREAMRLMSRLHISNDDSIRCCEPYAAAAASVALPSPSSNYHRGASHLTYIRSLFINAMYTVQEVLVVFLY
jgi:hypothetical protein